MWFTVKYVKKYDKCTATDDHSRRLTLTRFSRINRTNFVLKDNLARPRASCKQKGAGVYNQVEKLEAEAESFYMT